MKTESYKNIPNQEEENIKVDITDPDLKEKIDEIKENNNLEGKESEPVELKSQLEIAMERADEMIREDESFEEVSSDEELEKLKQKVEEEKEEYENALKKEDISFNSEIANANSVEEICSAIKTKEAVVGSRKVYEADDLNLMIREIVSGERSLSYVPRVSGIREKVREIREQEREKERQLGNEKIQQIFVEQPSDDDFESQDKSESKVETVSKLGLKTWHKWEMLTDRSRERGFIEKMKKEIEKLEARANSLSEGIDSKRGQLESEKEKYQNAIGKISDPTILKSFEKSYKDKIDKINKEIEESEKDRDSLEEKISINKEKIKDSEGSITEIEKRYTDKIDSKISEIKDKYNYLEIEESLEENKELLNKFIMFLEKTDETIVQIETALENKDLLSKEDVREIKNRLKNLKKRKKTLLKGIKKIASLIKADSKDLIYVEGKISKLEVLKP